MKIRLFSVLLVVVFVLSLVPAVSAQGGMECFNLPAADCEFLMAATANTGEAQSFALSYDFQATLGGLGTLGAMMGGDVAMGDITLASTGSGDLVEATDAFPPIAMTMDLTASLTGTGEDDASGETSFVIVDGYLYVLDPESGQWMGMLIEDAMNSLDPETKALLGGLASGEMPGGAMTPGDLTADPTALLESLGIEGVDQLVNIPDFINFERLADADGMAPFSLTIDSGPLFENEQFQTILTNIVNAAAAEDPDAAQIAMMAPMLLSGVSIVFNETTQVGLDDNLIHGVTLTLDASLDLSVLMPPSSGESAAPALPPITLHAQINITLDQFNEAFEIVAPEGAVMVDPSEM